LFARKRSAEWCRSKLVFILAGCRLQGWVQPATGSMAAYIDPSVRTWPNDCTAQLVPML
jgi:AraC family transcriptional regulator